METIFKKYFWVIQALGLAAATGLAASALVTQIGTGIALAAEDPEADAKKAKDDASPDEDDPDAAEGETISDAYQRNLNRRSLGSGSKRIEKQQIADAILTRNIFCPTCVPEVPTTPAFDPADSPVPSYPGAPTSTIQPGEVKSALALKLMATMEATNPDFSLATIYDADERTTGLFGIGDNVRAGVAVMGVSTGIVHLRNNARLEYIQLGADLPPPPPLKSPLAQPFDENGTPTTDPSASSAAIPGAEDSINCPNENLCIVERKLVDQLMANPVMLAKQARIVPSTKNGETQGYKFYGIRRDSLPKMLGLKNGDMLTTVNGEEVRSVDQAMALALKLRQASNLSVTIVRKGQTIQKEIQIQ